MMKEREKHPFSDAEIFTAFKRDSREQLIVAGWRWPHESIFGDVRPHSSGFVLKTLGLDGVE